MSLSLSRARSPRAVSHDLGRVALEPQESLAQGAGLQPADLELLAVAEDGQVRAAGQHADLHDHVDVGDRSAPEPEEARRIETRLQVLQAVGDGERLVLRRDQVQELALGDDRGNLRTCTMTISSRRRTGIRVRYGSFAAVSYASMAVPTRTTCSSRISSCSMRSCARLSVSRSRALLDRLQEIVDGVQLERVHGILVVRRHEGDERHPVLLQQSDDADAVELRHLQIEQRQIRPLPLDDRHGVASRRGFADEHGVIERPQERGEECAGRSLVVRDDDAKTLAHTAFRIGGSCTTRSAGRTMVTVVPRPGAVSARQCRALAILAGQPAFDVAQADARLLALANASGVAPAPVSCTDRLPIPPSCNRSTTRATAWRCSIASTSIRTTRHAAPERAGGEVGLRRAEHVRPDRPGAAPEHHDVQCRARLLARDRVEDAVHRERVRPPGSPDVPAERRPFADTPATVSQDRTLTNIGRQGRRGRIRPATTT